MLKVLWNGSNGLYANQNRMDMLSNNIANINTNGYKSADVAFQEIFSNSMDRMGLPETAEGDQRKKLTSGTGVKADIVNRDFSEGNIVETGMDNDLAIKGNAFLQVIDDNGNPYYTRDGSFNVDTNGNIVHSASGYKFDLDNKNYNPSELKKPFSFKIDDSGNVFSDKVDSTGKVSEHQLVGKLKLYKFTTNDEMISRGDNLYIPQDNNKAQQVNFQNDNVKVMQGYVEKSNVNLGKTLTDMIVAQRAYVMSSKAIKTADDMMQIENNLRSR